MKRMLLFVVVLVVVQCQVQQFLYSMGQDAQQSRLVAVQDPIMHVSTVSYCDMLFVTRSGKLIMQE